MYLLNLLEGVMLNNLFENNLIKLYSQNETFRLVVKR